MRPSSWCALSTALLVVACSPKGSVPGQAQILCKANSDCPSGWLCEEFWGRCVNRSVPGTAPTVTAHTATVALGRVVVTLDVDLELASPPKVRLLTGTTTALELSLQAQAGTHYEFAGIVTAAIGDGPHAVVADLLSTRGAETRDVSLGTVIVDFTPPALRTATIVEGRLVEGKAALRAGATATVEVLFSEPLPSPPTAATGGHALETIATAERDRWRFRVTARGDEPQGAVPIAITTADSAGNEALLALDGLFRFDFTAPALDPAFAPSVDPVIVRLGQTVYASFSLTEATGPETRSPTVELVPVSDDETLSVDPVPADTLEMVDDQTHVGGTWRYFHTVQAGEAPGTYEVRLSAYEDDAGNRGAARTLGSVVIDATPPVSARPVPTRPDATYRAGDVVEVQLVLDADVGTTPAGWLDTRPAVPIACTGVSTREFLCRTVRPLDGTERPEGTVAVILNVTDTAGYRSLASTAVALDFTPPRLASAQVVGTRTIFTDGDEVLLEAVFSEPLAEPPQAQLVPAGAVAAEATQVANVWRFRTTVGAAEAEGTLGLRVTRAVDRTGNADPDGAGTILGLFTVDRTPPALVAPSFAPTTVTPGTSVLATFTTSEPLAQAPNLAASPLGGGTSAPFRLAASGGGGKPWEYELVVPVDATPGAYTVDVTGVVDLARNVGAPASVGTLVVVPASGAAVASATGPYRAGDIVDVQLVLGFDPPFAPSGRLESTPPLPVTCVPQVAGVYRCTTAPLTGAETEGSIPVVLDYLDAGGGAASAATRVTLDFTAPVISPGTVTPPSALGGEVVTVTFSASEALAATPIVSARAMLPLAEPPVYSLRLVTAGSATTPWTFALDVPVTAVAATYDLQVDGVVDLAGNLAFSASVGTVTLAPRPPLATVTVLKAPPYFKWGDVVQVEVVRTTPGLDPTAVLANPTTSMTCAPTATSTWLCESLPVVGFEGEVSANVLVTVPDPLGDDVLTAVVNLDAWPPSPNVVSFGLSPPPGSRVASPSAATGGTYVSIVFDTSEPTVGTPTVEVATPEPLVFTGGQDGHWYFSATLAPGAHVDGDWSLDIGLVDLAGNASTTTVTTFRVDSTPPAPPAVDTPELVVLHRTPAGSAFGFPFSVRGGPFATEPSGVVLVLDGSSATTSIELGRATASPVDGSFAVDLGPAVDAAEVWVMAVDSAANPSTALVPPVRVRDVAWTVRPTVDGPLLPRMEQRTSLGALEDPFANPVTASPSLASPDGSELYLQGEPRWVDQAPLYAAGAQGPTSPAFAVLDPAAGQLRILETSAAAPVLGWADGAWTLSGTIVSGDTVQAAAYDTFREELLAVTCALGGGGGPTLAFPTLGTTWLDRAPVGTTPPCSPTTAVMAFDAGRGLAVWWDASGATTATWTWDGQAWTALPIASPGGGGPAAMAYDATRGVVVLFRSDPSETVWEFDGAAWTPRAATALRPSVFSSTRLAAATFRGAGAAPAGVAVLDDAGLAVWNGATFTPLDPAGAITGWTSVALAPGPRAGTLVAVRAQIPMEVALLDTASMTWRSVGWGWDLLGAETRLVFNPDLGQVQVFAIDATGVAGLRTWSDGWSAADAIPLATTTITWVGDVSVAAGAGGEVLAFGGLRADPFYVTTDELWSWLPGSGWALATPPGGPTPGARAGAAMVYDASWTQYLLYGGDPSDDQLWGFSGPSGWFVSWTPAARTLRPSPLRAALSVDPFGNRWVFEGPIPWLNGGEATRWSRLEGSGEGPAYEDWVLGVDTADGFILVAGKDIFGQPGLWGFDYQSTSTWQGQVMSNWSAVAPTTAVWNPRDRSILALTNVGAAQVARLDSGVSPAFVLRVPTRGPGLVVDTPCPPGSCTMVGLDVRWRGSGYGYPRNGATEIGTNLLVWDGTGWRLLGQNFEGNALSVTTTDAALLRRVFVGADGTLNLAWRPALPGATAPDRISHTVEVTTDYAELTLRYRLP